MCYNISSINKYYFHLYALVFAKRFNRREIIHYHRDNIIHYEILIIASRMQNCILKSTFSLEMENKHCRKNNDTKIVITIRKAHAISML